jgi:hypothetical protein
MKAVHGSGVASLRVVKKLSVTSRGALKLAQQFGEGLVCVRHRVDARGEMRFTTVEVLVGQAPVRHRTQVMVGVRIGAREHALQQMVRAAGAKWDAAKRVWTMPRRVASILRLGDRLVEM